LHRLPEQTRINSRNEDKSEAQLMIVVDSVKVGLMQLIVEALPTAFQSSEISALAKRDSQSAFLISRIEPKMILSSNQNWARYETVGFSDVTNCPSTTTPGALLLSIQF
jgi:hypothetical protein